MVLARPGVVGAAPVLTRSFRFGPPPASPGCCDSPAARSATRTIQQRLVAHDLGLHQLVQHTKPDADAQRQQPFLRGAGDSPSASRTESGSSSIADSSVAADAADTVPMRLVLVSSWTWLAPVTVPSGPDEAGGPPPQVLRTTGQPRRRDRSPVLLVAQGRSGSGACPDASRVSWHGEPLGGGLLEASQASGGSGGPGRSAPLRAPRAVGAGGGPRGVAPHPVPGWDAGAVRDAGCSGGHRRLQRVWRRG
jgi:hypothetical protein